MLKLLSLFFCINSLFALHCAAKKSSDGCTINLTTDFDKSAPVILISNSHNNFKLFKPTGRETTLDDGTKLILACVGKNNTIKSTKKITLELHCSKGKFVSNDKKQRKTYKLRELECKSVPHPTLLKTNEKCMDEKSYIYRTGFNINSKFYGPVVEICYNNATERTLYTHNTLNGRAIKYAISDSKRPHFSADGMKFTTTEADLFYKKENQIEVFKKLFGSNQKYINTNSFLARGHLSPDADFIFVSESFATYYYTNVAPQFQSINAGNWLNVEKLAREISVAYNGNIESYNSYSGILELPKNQKMVKVYLDGGAKIEVPQYFYKILVHKASDSAIVFVTLNNPFLEKSSKKPKEFCENVCKKSGLNNSKFSDVTKGYTFCCKLNEFKLKSKVKNLPKEIKGNKLLTKKEEK